MNRYRITVLVVCVVLIVLAVGDFYTLRRNYEPQVIAWDQISGGISLDREWVTITGGTLMLEDAISNSGELEIDALVIPLVRDIGDKTFYILVETRDPKLIETLMTYKYAFDTEHEQAEFLEKNIEMFRVQRTVSGMVVVGAFGGLMPNRDQETMRELAKSENMELDENVIFVHEGNEPAKPYRGIFFLLMGIAGIIKVIIVMRQSNSGTASNSV
ncbi:MAG: hypothetical protein D6B28_02305 [Gammaproteobacteria bacterium]|nr:MAG: hypothetical protein D6B28_02305 [Gammaproteobacteria bacterium]